MNAPATTAAPAHPAPAHLRLRGLAKTYPGTDRPAVDGVSLDLAEGQLLALLGPSGCGKTTTLRMIAGLVEPTGGAIEVGGRDVTDVPVHRRGMGLVFQSYALFPHLDVARNVAFGLAMRKVARADRDARVSQALDMVQLGHLAGRRTSALSGGQQQRVALARALVIEPSLLLLDEPLSNLDAKLRDAMREEIRAIVARTGVTTVFVTHDQDEALSMADVVAVMNDGHIEQIGAPVEIYSVPRTRFVADFIGRANLLPGHVLAGGADQPDLEVPDLGSLPARQHPHAPIPAGQAAHLLLRPHQLRLHPADGAGPGGSSRGELRLRGEVTGHSYTGDLLATTVRVGPYTLTVETLTGEGPSWQVGDDVTVTARTSDTLLVRDDQAA